MLPDFSSDRLKGLLAGEFIFRLYSDPTLFRFPWLGDPRIAHQRGHNFLLLFGLSELIEDPLADEFSHWNEPYCRFNIPQRKVERTVDHLIGLAKQGFQTYYVTNHVMSADELQKLSLQMKLLDEAPFLKLAADLFEHSCATFTRDSTHFWLHSRPRKEDRMRGSSLLADYRNTQSTLLMDDLALLSDTLQQYQSHNPSEQPSIARELAKFSHFPEDQRVRVHAFVTAQFLAKLFSVLWLHAKVD